MTVDYLFFFLDAALIRNCYEARNSSPGKVRVSSNFYLKSPNLTVPSVPTNCQGHCSNPCYHMTFDDNYLIFPSSQLVYKSQYQIHIGSSNWLESLHEQWIEYSASQFSLGPDISVGSLVFSVQEFSQSVKFYWEVNGSHGNRYRSVWYNRTPTTSFCDKKSKSFPHEQ